MKTLSAMLSANVLLVMLVACGSDESADSGPAATTERAPTVGAEIADDFNNSIDRAKNVEDQVMQQKDRMDAALKEAEDDT